MPAKRATRMSAATSKTTSIPHDCGSVRGACSTGARRVVVPSSDVASRLQRFFPRPACVVTPWENDDAAAPPAASWHQPVALRIAIVGAIGIEKGYEYLLACARHVATQRLALEFVVVGHTCDDKRLLDTGVVSITGPYDEAEAVELIRSQQAQLGFLPALWPETWSYTLSQMWQAGLDVLAFDIGAPAERIRATGRGRLLPLGLPPASACGALLDYEATEPGQGRAPKETHPRLAGRTRDGGSLTRHDPLPNPPPGREEENILQPTRPSEMT